VNVWGAIAVSGCCEKLVVEPGTVRDPEEEECPSLEAVAKQRLVRTWLWVLCVCVCSTVKFKMQSRVGRTKEANKSGYQPKLRSLSLAYT
jgi:hypothetical protein